MSKEKVLITGGTGSLGTALSLECQRMGFGVQTPTRQELNLNSTDSIQHFTAANRYSAIIHSAAITDWNVCHTNPAEAHQVNSHSSALLAVDAKNKQIPYVFVSTDAVFPGSKPLHRGVGYSESDPAQSPVSMYGITKLAAETLIQAVNEDALIVRLGWLFGPDPSKDKKFVGAIVRQLAMGKDKIQAVDDKFGSPTFAVDAASKIVELLDNNTKGIRHVVNEGVASRYDVAQQVVKLWKPSTEVFKVTSDAFPSIVQRPDFSGMETEYSDTKMRKWQEALTAYHTQYPRMGMFNQNG